MTELERNLVALGRDLDIPAEPNIAAYVRARLEPRRPRRRIAVAVALAALAVALAFAIPPARSAILRVLHLGGATIERVETLPRAQERPLASGLGLPLHRERAERIAGFTALVPRGVEPALYAWDDAVAMLVRVHGTPVLIAETSGANMEFAHKYTTMGARVVDLTVDGRPGVWIAGAPHVVEFQSGEPRLAGNVLLLLKADLTVRIEGDIRRSDALDLAHSLR